MGSVSTVSTTVGRSARLWRRGSGLRRIPVIPIAVVIVLALCAVFANVLSPHDPRGKDESIRIRTQKNFAAAISKLG
jgi:hypothetical protein